MQQCSEAALKKVRFPSTRAGRQQVVHVVRRVKRGGIKAGGKPEFRKKRSARKPGKTPKPKAKRPAAYK
jgi:hypothetical protein